MMGTVEAIVKKYALVLVMELEVVMIEEFD